MHRECQGCKIDEIKVVSCHTYKKHLWREGWREELKNMYHWGKNEDTIERGSMPHLQKGKTKNKKLEDEEFSSDGKGSPESPEEKLYTSKYGLFLL